MRAVRVRLFLENICNICICIAGTGGRALLVLPRLLLFLCCLLFSFHLFHALTSSKYLCYLCYLCDFKNNFILCDFDSAKLLKKQGTCKLSRHEFPSRREKTTCGVVADYSNEIWSVIPRASAMH